MSFCKFFRQIDLNYLFGKYSTRRVVTCWLHWWKSAKIGLRSRQITNDKYQISFYYYDSIPLSWLFDILFTNSYIFKKLIIITVKPSRLHIQIAKFMYPKKDLIFTGFFLKKQGVEVWLLWSKFISTKECRLLLCQVQMLIWLQ